MKSHQRCTVENKDIDALKIIDAFLISAARESCKHKDLKHMGDAKIISMA